MTLNPKDNPPVVYPAQVFDWDLASQAVWWVGRTKPRQEKAVARDLRMHGIAYFLPLVARPQRSIKRMRMSLLPLFSGYVFFRGDVQDRHNIMKTGRLAQILSVRDQVGLNSQLAGIARAIEHQMDLDLCDLVREGTRVRITHGPLVGVEGLVQKMKNPARLILNVSVIAQAAMVEVDLDQVEPINK